jgi:hypothetical protein
MCRRHRAVQSQVITAAAARPSRVTQNKMVRLPRPGPASPTTSSSGNVASWIQSNHDARLDEINSEVLQNADVAPPTYEEVARSGAVALSARSSSTRPAPSDAPYPNNSKLARDLDYYNNTRPAQQDQHQQYANSDKGSAGIPNKEEREAVRAHFDELSDAESDDDSWDLETIAGIDTPGTTVHGDEQQRHIEPRAPEALHRDSLPDLSLLERIRQRHGLPPRERWSRSDWKLAKAEYRAERRAARANWRAERHAMRAAHWDQKKEAREERSQHRADRREERHERRAARRGGCCSR